MTILHTADREKLRIEDGDDRWYHWKGEDGFVSVTTAIQNGTPKWGIAGGGRKQTALGALIMHDTIHQLIKGETFEPDSKGKPKGEGGKEAYKRMWRYVDEKWDLARDNGTEVHDYLESRLIGSEAPAPSNVDVADMQIQVDDFLNTVKPTVHAAEAVVFNRRYGYAGTLDAVFEFDDETKLHLPGKCLVDAKTGTSVWPDVAMQLAALGEAEFIGLDDGTEVPMFLAESYAVLHIRPNGWQIRPIVVDGNVFATFLATIDVSQWAFKYSKKRVGTAVLKGKAK